MLDLQFICDHRDLVVDNCKKRGVEVNVDAVVRLRDERNALIAKGDELRRQQKEVSAQIPKASAEDRPKLVEQGKQLRDQVSQTEEQQKKVEEQLRDEQIRIPNMTHPSAPIGGEEDAFEIRVWGDKPKFDFKPKDHVEIAANLDLIDFEALGQEVIPAEMIRRLENRPVGDRPLHRRTEQQRRLDPQADLIDPSGRERAADGSGRPLGGGRPGARPPLVPPREEVVVEVVAGGEPNAIDVIHVPRLSRWNRGRDQVTRIFPAKECGTRRVDDRRHLDVLHPGDRRPDVAIPRPDDLREDS